MRRLFSVIFVLCLAASGQSAIHTWTGTAYSDGALADGDTVVGQNVTNNCVLTNNNLTLQGTWSNATWTGNVIAGTGLQKLLISNLIFYATDNGLGKTYSNSFNAFSLTGSDIEICSCIVTGLYYRVESTECGGAPQGITLGLSAATNVTIHNNVLDMIGNAVVISYSGFSSNVQVYSNTITRVSWGVFLNTTSPGDAYGYRVWANTINHLEAWNPMGGPCGGSYHNDCIIVSESSGGATNHSLRIDRNLLGPSVHVASAEIYVNPNNLYSFPGLLVCNNVFLLDDLTTSSLMLQISPSNAIAACNTFVPSSGSLSKSAIVGLPEGSILNNLTAGITLGISHATGVFPTESDYNIWNILPGGDMAYTPFESFATWQARGFDAHSTTTAPVLNADYSLATNSPVGIGTGTNLTALGITEDFLGSNRVAVGAWDVGAFNSQGGATPIAPVAAFTGSPLSGTVPLLVTFTNTSTDATNYLWDFGDSVIATSTNAIHSYTNAAAYTVSLRAIGAGGTNTLTRSGYVNAVLPYITNAWNIGVLDCGTLHLGP